MGAPPSAESPPVEASWETVSGWVGTRFFLWGSTSKERQETWDSVTQGEETIDVSTVVGCPEYGRRRFGVCLGVHGDATKSTPLTPSLQFTEPGPLCRPPVAPDQSFGAKCDLGVDEDLVPTRLPLSPILQRRGSRGLKVGTTIIMVPI